jgi:ADP-heptose:LPS heptosyltransferase
MVTGNPPPAVQIRRILVTAYGHTADTLPAAPCLRELRSRYPGAEIHVLVVEQVAELWSACPYVDRTHVMRDFQWKGSRRQRPEQLVRLAGLVARFRGRYDMVIVLHARSWFFSCFAYLSGARYRAGYQDGRPARWLTHAAEPYDGIVSFREENRRVMAALGIPVGDHRLELWPTADARTEADGLLASVPPTTPLIGLHPGSHWACQRWHNDRWATVADALMERYGVQVVITGSPDERGWADEIAAHMRRRPIIAAGATSLPGFAEVVSRCRVLLCVNSAASQVGLATGTPVVNLVGLEPLGWTAPEPGEAMAVVCQSSQSSVSWCPLGVWGRLSQCQIAEHVGLAGLSHIRPDHVLAAAIPWMEGLHMSTPQLDTVRDAS